MPLPRVLYVVPTLGERPDWLQATLRSLREQHVPLHIRIVAPSGAPVEDVASENGAELIRCDELGLSRALNVGFGLDSPECATYEFVGWLGDDDLLAPESLSASVHALDQYPSAAGVYGYCRYIDGSGKTLWIFKSPKWAPWYAQYGADFIPQPGSVVRNSALRLLGGLDESYRQAMDYDLFLRLREHGRLVRLRRELAAFRVHEASITSSKATGEESDRARRENAVRRGRLRWYSTIRRLTILGDKALVRVLRRPERSERQGEFRGITYSSS